MGKLFANLDGKSMALLLGMTVLAIVFWNTLLVYPLKILVVFFHELSHGLAAWLTGGSIEEIQLVPAEGGLCITRGGSRFVTLSAGYLGSLLWGGAILLLAARTRIDRAVSIGLGVILLAVSLMVIRPWFGFGFVFCVVSGLALIAVGAFLSEGVNDFLLRLVGLTSCLYAVLDIKSDILDRPELRSDAAMLGDLTGLPTVFWGLVWIGLALVASFFFLIFASKAGGGQSSEAEQA